MLKNLDMHIVNFDLKCLAYNSQNYCADLYTVYSIMPTQKYSSFKGTGCVLAQP